jgi:hypothetical protein
MTGRIIVANGRATESVGRYDCDDFMAFGEPRPHRTCKENEGRTDSATQSATFPQITVGSLLTGQRNLLSADRRERRIELLESGTPGSV